MNDKNNRKLKIGQKVFVTPNPDNVASEEFTGTIKDIKRLYPTGRITTKVATVVDQEDNAFDCHENEIEKLDHEDA